MMKNKILFLTATMLFLSVVARADQGMWLPSLIKDGRIKQMKERGLRLSAEDLYSINQASLKDAVVQFGGGCTAELISDQGLLLTNHHCGFSQIQAHSSLEKDYLKNGFVAMNRSEELPNKGLTVSFLKQMSDVTGEATNGVVATMTASERQALIAKNIKDITTQATKDNKYKASVEPLYYGNQYFLFVYEVFSDVRMVFAPASSIGKFGGDTDNWMWPRHTGDFSIFRIYADKNNNPADYSVDNVPYKPKKSLTISRGGVKQGDFTMVYGFPGRTSQYLHSKAVHYITEQTNPTRIELRTKILVLMNEAAISDPEVRIKYAAKNAGISNGWKKWQGESQGLHRLGTVGKKEAQEADFRRWAADKPEYQGITEQMATLYDSLQPWSMAMDYYNEALFAVEALSFVRSLIALNDSTYNATKLKGHVQAYFKDHDRELDLRIAKEMLSEFGENIDSQFIPQSSDIKGLTTLLLNDKLFTDKDAMLKLFEGDKSLAISTIKNNPIYLAIVQLSDMQSGPIRKRVVELNRQITELYRPYMRGLMAMQSDREFYPDANFTLRVAYGRVAGYEPRDAVYYKHYSTLNGVAQKDNPSIYDYDVPEKLREVIRTGDYGEHEVDGSVPVAFIATNHTTGGNSGSPVLNARGELVGINFDRTWEGTMSDIEFDETVCRNIALDIRYVLFVVDKIGGAGYLMDEMKFSKKR